MCYINRQRAAHVVADVAAQCGSCAHIIEKTADSDAPESICPTFSAATVHGILEHSAHQNCSTQGVSEEPGIAMIIMIALNGLY